MAHGIDRYRVRPGTGSDLARLDPRDRSAFEGGKAKARARAEKLRARLQRLQYDLYAEHRRALLVVLQAMDAGGKDGVVRAVFAGVNPQGVRVTAFARPTPAELAHDFLWRVHPHAPARGQIAIWNRSHYEDVVAARVRDGLSPALCRRRCGHIVAFERLLADSGTVIRKFFLHVGKDEQRERLQERLDDPRKRWKFAREDLEDRARWDEFQTAYADAIAATSTAGAPWYVVPADRNWYRDLVVVEVIVAALEAMDLRVPSAPPDLGGLDLGA